MSQAPQSGRINKSVNRDDDDSDWEYEYHETETEVRYSSYERMLNLRRKHVTEILPDLQRDPRSLRILVSTSKTQGERPGLHPEADNNLWRHQPGRPAFSAS